MPLSVGTQLGPYEVLGPLGAGGMGEVYRARDTRLDRTVAIKILPAHLSERPQARERFDREARAISSISHPNICHLYDVGQQNGASYLVMEYLEGETLATRLAKGPLPLEQALRVGAEIAEGLDRAHRGGVVHRDLKPGNIMLTKSGAKLMDFGLAKAATPVSPPSSGVTQTLASPTHPLTAEGTMVGTFQYMSPEQVEGKEADARSDIFALGAVLYEMVTGKRAFVGKTTASVLAAVLERQPAPISALLPMTPPAVDRLVRTCLAKDPEHRWQTAHDVGLQLKQIAEGSSQADMPALPAPAARPRQPLAWGLAGLFAVLAITAAVMAYLAGQKPWPTLRVQINPPDKTSFNLAGDTSGPAVVSPDGRYVVFSARDETGSRLYLRSLDSLTPQPLPGTEGAMFPFWSPDSRSVAFFGAEKLKRVEISGGAPVNLCDVGLARGGSWGGNGTILFAPSYNTGIFQIPASGGTPTPITHVDNVAYTSHRWPWMLPDGKHFLYLAVNHNAETSPDTAVFFASLDGKENRLLLHSLSNAIFVAGHLFYLRENTIVAQPFDPASGQLQGDSRPLSESVHYDRGLWRANFSASNNGMLVYASGSSSATQKLVWYDRSGKALNSIGDRDGYYDVSLSPDNKKVAVTDANSANSSIWIYDTTGTGKLRLTFNGVQRSPVWSPDGTQIAYTSNQQNSIVVKASSGSEQEKPLLTAATGLYQGISDWSPDGRYLMYQEGTGTNLHLKVLPLFGDRKPFAYTNSSADERNGQFSPDGRWVAYQSTATGRPEIFVSPFPATGARWQVSNGGGVEAHWRGDGKELFYDAFDEITAVDVDGSGPTFQVGASKPLLRLSLANVSWQYAVSHDGQRILAIVPAGGSSQVLTLVQNWTSELNDKP